VPGAPGPTLLDAGCGIGWFTQRFADAGFRLAAVGFTDEAVRLDRGVVSNLAAMVGPGGALVVQEQLVDRDDVTAKQRTGVYCVRWRMLEMYRSLLGSSWVLERHDHFVLDGEGSSKDLLLFRQQ